MFEENKVIFNEKKEAAKQAIYPEVKFIKQLHLQYAHAG
jgi:L(+)-tartrate dehydratase beta subunit